MASILRLLGTALLVSGLSGSALGAGEVELLLVGPSGEGIGGAVFSAVPEDGPPPPPSQAVLMDQGNRSRLRLHRYDNNGDLLAVEDGQWAWDTRFHHFGWHLRLPGELVSILQAVDGSTEMAGFTGPLVYVDFTAWTGLLSRPFDSQRLWVRYDDFQVVDEDAIPEDPNDENGHAWTVAWFRRFDPIGNRGRWRIGVELLSVTSRRSARAIFAEDPDRSEELLQMSLAWRF